jgi:hypothetical protein
LTNLTERQQLQYLRQHTQPVAAQHTQYYEGTITKVTTTPNQDKVLLTITYDDGDEKIAEYPDKDGDIELLPPNVKLEQKVACRSKRKCLTDEEPFHR